MKIKIRHSALIFLLLVLMNLTITLFLLINYSNKNRYDTESVAQFFEDKITNTFEKMFFHTQLAEVLARLGYQNFSREEMAILLGPVIAEPGIINVSFLPRGIVEYVFPLEGNEEAIGDNVFEMPSRRKEAELAMELREAILCGPYRLTQGGTGLIMRKAIFVPNGQGGEEFWGMVAVVVDAATILYDMDLKQIEQLGYTYELSTLMSGEEKKVIAKSEHYSSRNAVHSFIALPNGGWQLSVSKNVDFFQAAIVLMVFSFGLMLSVARYSDLRKREQEFETIQNEMFIDNLTGLYNRKRLSVIEEQLAQKEMSYTVFYLDLNDFKQVNDTYGHEVGDRLLAALARRLVKVIREGDLAIRMGGDEFVLLLLNIVEEQAIQSFSRRLEDLQKETLLLGPLEITPALSYGYATCPTDGQGLEEILQCADLRMYQSKKRAKEGEKHKGSDGTSAAPALFGEEETRRFVDK